jgi:pimeloyl-ACP methyl ester carboxylesterase
MAIARLHGVELHVQTLGAGPCVAMVHGLMLGSMATWYFSAAAALRDRCRVVLYDLRGHGKSERATSGYDLGTQLGDLHAVLDHAGAAETALVGHSYGGLIALHYALAHPERVRQLVLVDVPLPAARMAGFHDDAAPDPDALLAMLPAPLRAAVLGGRRQAVKLVSNLAFLYAQTTLIADVRAAGDVADDALATLSCPTLCIVGRDSDCLPAGERIARLAPDARLALVPGGHQVPLEAADAMTRLISEFVPWRS